MKLCVIVTAGEEVVKGEKKFFLKYVKGTGKLHER